MVPEMRGDSAGAGGVCGTVVMNHFINSWDAELEKGQGWAVETPDQKEMSKTDKT